MKVDSKIHRECLDACWLIFSRNKGEIYGVVVDLRPRSILGGGTRTLTVRVVPVNLKTEDRFHLAIEEYLHAVISLADELVIPLACTASEVLEAN